MGGDEPAHTLIAAALSVPARRSSPRTSTSIAHHGPELEAIARRTGAALRFEAAVGGGIPVLGPLAARPRRRTAIGRVRGIVNGTTNYILTAMTDAEGRATTTRSSPTPRRPATPRRTRAATSRAHDAVNKLVILARLAFGRWLDPAVDRDAGPDGRGGRPARASPAVTAEEHADAAARGRPRCIRLLATARPADARRRRLARRRPADGRPARLAARPDRRRPEPDRDRRRSRSARSASTGPGAGGAATRSAVLGDLIAIARGARVDLGPAAAAGDAAPAGDPVRAAPAAARRPSRRATASAYPIDD